MSDRKKIRKGHEVQALFANGGLRKSEIVGQLLDRSGMWFSGDGGSGGPNPKLAEPVFDSKTRRNRKK